MGDIYIDPLIQEIALQNRNPDVWGLVLTVLWPAPESFRKHYEDFCSKIKAIDANGAIYIYPFDTLHSTVISISPFLPGKGSLTELPENDSTRQEMIQRRQKWCDGWVNSLSRVLQRIDDRTRDSLNAFPSRARLSYTRPIFSRAAGIFFIDNPTGEIDGVRQRVKTECMSDPMSPELVEAEFIRNDYVVPNIRHTTFFRFIREPAADFQEKFEHLVNTEWRDISVDYTESEIGPTLCLVEEIHPYMHVSRDECLATFALPNTQ